MSATLNLVAYIFFYLKVYVWNMFTLSLAPLPAKKNNVYILTHCWICTIGFKADYLSDFHRIRNSVWNLEYESVSTLPILFCSITELAFQNVPTQTPYLNICPWEQLFSGESRISFYRYASEKTMTIGWGVNHSPQLIVRTVSVVLKWDRDNILKTDRQSIMHRLIGWQLRCAMPTSRSGHGCGSTSPSSPKQKLEDNTSNPDGSMELSSADLSPWMGWALFCNLWELVKNYDLKPVKFKFEV